MNVHKWSIMGFQQRDRQDSQYLNNDTFCRLLLVALNVLMERKITLMLAYQ